MACMTNPLERATETDLAELDEASHGEWGYGLPLAAHRARERTLRESPWSRGGHTGWVLRQGAEILASCETYAMPCQVHGEPGTAWGIASVFVRPSLRGKGYASELLQALAERLSSEAKARALILFSDVGPSLYERLGYRARPAWDRVLEPSRAPLEEGPWRLIEEPVASRGPAGHAFLLWPTAPQLGWHLARARTWAEAVGEPVQRWCGAALGEELVVWVEDRHEDILRVLLWTGEPLLLEVAARQAAELGLQRVVVWESSWEGAWPEEAQRVEREGALPMLLPLREGVEAADWRLVPRGVWV
jgi:GNAT superfamily N-acetyltransferase